MLRFQISLVMLISNGTAEINLAILAFWCCGEFVKTSNAYRQCSPHSLSKPYLVIHVDMTFLGNVQLIVGEFCTTRKMQDSITREALVV